MGAGRARRAGGRDRRARTRRCCATDAWRGTRGAALADASTDGRCRSRRSTRRARGSTIPVLVGTTRDEATFLFRAGRARRRVRTSSRAQGHRRSCSREPTRALGVRAGGGGRRGPPVPHRPSPRPTRGWARCTRSTSRCCSGRSGRARSRATTLPTTSRTREVSRAMQREWGRFLHGAAIQDWRQFLECVYTVRHHDHIHRGADPGHDVARRAGALRDRGRQRARARAARRGRTGARRRRGVRRRDVGHERSTAPAPSARSRCTTTTTSTSSSTACAARSSCGPTTRAACSRPATSAPSRPARCTPTSCAGTTRRSSARSSPAAGTASSTSPASRSAPPRSRRAPRARRRSRSSAAPRSQFKMKYRPDAQYAEARTERRRRAPGRAAGLLPALRRRPAARAGRPAADAAARRRPDRRPRDDDDRRAGQGPGPADARPRAHLRGADGARRAACA